MTFAVKEEANNIGSMMKIPPYAYQKDIIQACLEAKRALIISPCGSGKSPAMLGLYLEAKKAGIIKGPGLVVVKTSLKIQWEREVQKFTDLTSVIVPTSINVSPLYKKATKLIKSQTTFDAGYDMLLEADNLFIKKIGDADILILNYETLNDENVRRVIKRLKPDFVACDEIQYVKSSTAIRSKSLADTITGAIIRVGATATPVQRDPMDLFGIYKIIKPDLFPDKKSFERNFVKYSGYGRISGIKNEDILREKIKPFMVIKTKEEVAKHLPQLSVTQHFCAMDPKVQEFSDRLMHEINDLQTELKDFLANVRHDPSEIESLRQTYPEIAKIESQIIMRQTFAQELADSQELLRLSNSEAAQRYVTKNKPDGKLDTLMDILETYWDEDPQRKICIFSKYKRMQSVIANAINTAGKKNTIFADTGIAYINGDLSAEKRYEEVYQKFQGEKAIARLLLCSDAGAEGINLPECSVLIEYDLADSYAIQTQRHGRVERANSQFEHADVIQLIALNSWDEIQFKIVAKKKNYDSSLIHGETAD